ncbi:aryl-alcohol dehydrogenase-like predicted oxidoreductase [Actinocorallia herbida]|uniref:Aryl-alcohol dehydrogenase-like predicted oxidoreductase n=1 Tax=Actinocorallia herbida TaxID=58109 RepID=A0A3N1D4K2_9ACTN|nr:aldo/keto reductase [Actinocorallia herbida]ROO88473.1 aryl-alcohol dehydrogenase-like predicted oxidoreductase [Actinocorallia herbida]
MEHRQLGRSGLMVSRLGLGTMTWGEGTDPAEAARQLTAFVAAGGTLVDTADVYCDGLGEQILGSLLGTVVDRDELVLATKAGLTPHGYDSSRRHLLGALDRSLDRLGVDHVDLWQVNAYDPATPYEETLAALDEAIASGRTRYVGVSNYGGWQLATAATWQRAWPGRCPIVANQVEYSLLQRDPEREVLPAALSSGCSVLAWSPLGRGVLTGKYRNSIPIDSRAARDRLEHFVAPYLGEQSARIVESVATAAEGLGTTALAVALAWVRDQPGVAAPLVGARTTTQLKAALAADELTLPDEIRDALDDVSDVL